MPRPSPSPSQGYQLLVPPPHQLESTTMDSQKFLWSILHHCVPHLRERGSGSVDGRQGEQLFILNSVLLHLIFYLYREYQLILLIKIQIPTLRCAINQSILPFEALIIPTRPIILYPSHPNCSISLIEEPLLIAPCALNYPTNRGHCFTCIIQICLWSYQYMLFGSSRRQQRNRIFHPYIPHTCQFRNYYSLSSSWRKWTVINAYWAHHIADLKGLVEFNSIEFFTSGSPIKVEALSATTASLETSYARIEGIFNVSDRLTLKISNEAIIVHEIMQNENDFNPTNSFFKQPSSASLLSSASSPGDSPRYSITAYTSNADLSFEVKDAVVSPFPKLNLNARTSNGKTNVILHPTFEGSIMQ
ncbi:hypothetical protein M422DRAFT_43943 [Sphaerobolus stellatus SS14]|nr:hypothetical protein M422DRAFT_43943 [Sphaerobolus stellatus SS14]